MISRRFPHIYAYGYEISCVYTFGWVPPCRFLEKRIDEINENIQRLFSTGRIRRKKNETNRRVIIFNFVNVYYSCNFATSWYPNIYKTIRIRGYGK